MVMELGRLVYDVEVKDVGDNKKVLNNRMAIRNGKDSTTFIDIIAWNSTAELISTYFKKGYEILVEGRLMNVTRKKNEVEYDSIALLVNNIHFTSGNPKENKE